MLFIIVTLNLSAQHTDEHHHEEHHPKYELGLSNGIVYNLTEKEIAYGLHTHFIKTISRTNKLGIGLGYERIFDDHKHNAVSIIILY